MLGDDYVSDEEEEEEEEGEGEEEEEEGEGGEEAVTEEAEKPKGPNAILTAFYSKEEEDTSTGQFWVSMVSYCHCELHSPH